MRLLVAAVFGVLVSGCDPDSDFAAYCAATSNCQCSGTGCCSVSVCGDGSLSCCPGFTCESGQCTAETVVLDLSPSRIDFGQYPDLAEPPAISVLMKNSGNIAGQSRISLQVSSGEPSEFQVDSSACPVTLEPGASCTLKVRLTPSSLGLKQATLQTTGAGTPGVVTGVFGFHVGVNLSGVLLTTVQSSPAGMVCSGAACDGYFVGGISLSLTVASPYGVIWGPPCGTTTGVCAFTVTADSQVSATILPPLVVEVITPGTPSGYVQVEPGGLSCTGRCNLDVTGSVTLTALALPNGPSNATVFQGWTGACAGAGPVCTLDVTSATNTSVTLSDLNLAFVTGPVPLSTFGADGAGADAACNAAAGSAQNFVAWLATTTRNPAQLLGTSAGWVPTQNSFGYAPIARYVADITSARLGTYIPCASCFFEQPIVTGANPDGTSLPGAENCQNWTSSTGTATVGGYAGLGYAWSVDLGASPIPCNGSALLACFGTDTSGVVLTVQPAALGYAQYGVTFLSSPWIPTGGTAGGDSHCQSDAVAAGLTGTFGASSINPAFTSSFMWLVRSDGVNLGYISYGASPSNVDGFGNGVIPTVLSDTYVWKSYEIDNNTCNLWTGGAGALGTVIRFDAPFASPPPVACTEAHRLFCTQTQ
jgi:hypothetical protein